jgi:leucine-rich PPR motif-containing protein
MTNAGVTPTSSTYTQVLCMHAKNGDIEAIRNTFKECKEKKINFMDKDILDVIYTLAINKHSEHVEEV